MWQGTRRASSIIFYKCQWIIEIPHMYIQNMYKTQFSEIVVIYSFILQVVKCVCLYIRVVNFTQGICHVSVCFCKSPNIVMKMPRVYNIYASCAGIENRWIYRHFTNVHSLYLGLIERGTPEWPRKYNQNLIESNRRCAVWLSQNSRTTYCEAVRKPRHRDREPCFAYGFFLSSHSTYFLPGWFSNFPSSVMAESRLRFSSLGSMSFRRVAVSVFWARSLGPWVLFFPPFSPERELLNKILNIYSGARRGEARELRLFKELLTFVRDGYGMAATSGTRTGLPFKSWRDLWPYAPRGQLALRYSTVEGRLALPAAFTLYIFTPFTSCH